MTTFQASGTPPQRGKYRWIEKERDGGGWWLVGEPGRRLKIVGSDGDDLAVGFHLRAGATEQQAREVAALMNH